MSNRSLNPLSEFIEDVRPVLPYMGHWLRDLLDSLSIVFVDPWVALVSGKSRAKSNASWRMLLRHLWLTLLRYPAQLVLTLAALLLNALASLINNTGKKSQERVLSANEIDYLRAIFNDNLDYSVVRIQFGGIKEQLRIAPQAVGNDIFIRRVWWGTNMVNDDLSLTKRGYKLLGHEACHVWQFQHSGAGYIGDSLLIQVGIVLGPLLKVRMSDGYDLLRALRQGRVNTECNVEQQAVMAELIGEACASNARGLLDRRNFEKASNCRLRDDEFELVLRAHAWLTKKS